MSLNAVTGAAAVVGIALVGLLAGQYAKPPEPFSFEQHEAEKRARRLLEDSARRSEVAMPARMKAPEDLEGDIKGSLIQFGVSGAVRR